MQFGIYWKLKWNTRKFAHPYIILNKKCWLMHLCLVSSIDLQLSWRSIIMKWMEQLYRITNKIITLGLISFIFHLGLIRKLIKFTYLLSAKDVIPQGNLSALSNISCFLKGKEIKCLDRDLLMTYNCNPNRILL